MNRRHYQLFAVSMLIGAPLLVSVATNALPSIKGAMTDPSAQPAPVAPERQDSSDPMAALPAPLAPPDESAGQQGAQTSNPLDAAPSLDPVGIDPSASIGVDPAASAPQAKAPAATTHSAARTSEDSLTLPDVPPENRE